MRGSRLLGLAIRHPHVILHLRSYVSVRCLPFILFSCAYAHAVRLLPSLYRSLCSHFLFAALYFVTFRLIHFPYGSVSLRLTCLQLVHCVSFHCIYAFSRRMFTAVRFRFVCLSPGLRRSWAGELSVASSGAPWGAPSF
jgi:hypothetical protein